MSYNTQCHICGNVTVIWYPITGMSICRDCTKVLQALILEHQNADVMSGIVETISPEEEAAEDMNEEAKAKQELGSLDKTLKRNRRKNDA